MYRTSEPVSLYLKGNMFLPVNTQTHIVVHKFMHTVQDHYYEKYIFIIYTKKKNI